MKNFITRTISGFIYVLLVMGTIWAGQLWFGMLIFVFLVISLIELNKISRADEQPVNPLLFFIPSLLVYLVLYYLAIRGKWLTAPGYTAIFLIFLVLQLFSTRKTFLFTQSGYFLMTLLYLAIPLALLNFLFFVPVAGGKEVIIGFFIIIWLNDTFAYLTGKLFGRHKMFESVSPNKTWEGSIGGLLFGLGGAWMISLLSIDMSLNSWLGLAFITIVTGTFGDLFESMIKRRAKVKDSGSIMPGHGGVLDRLDSILISSPFVFLYLCYIV